MIFTINTNTLKINILSDDDKPLLSLVFRNIDDMLLNLKEIQRIFAETKDDEKSLKIIEEKFGKFKND